MYDFGSLVGEIGGVLGLLLGTSALSIYDCLGDVVIKKKTDKDKVAATEGNDGNEIEIGAAIADGCVETSVAKYQVANRNENSIASIA